MQFVRYLIRLLKALLNLDLDPYIERAFAKIEPFFVWLERWIPYFRETTLEHSIDVELAAGAIDEDARKMNREHYIPVRLELVANKLIADARDEEEKKKRSTFVEMVVHRCQFDFAPRLKELCSNFAPFDPDSDVEYEENFPPEEKKRRRAAFVEELKEFLKDCNYVEIPREELDRCLLLRRPGSIPVVARYDDFEEYRVFARGFKRTETVFSRYKGAGRVVKLNETILKRVCVVARLANNRAAEEPDEQAVVVKLFKDVSLDDLKLVAPRFEFKLNPFDGIKFGGGVLFGVSSLLAKALLTAVLTVFGFILLFFGFVAAIVKGGVDFFRRRTVYSQKHSKTLYYKSLAANRAAISLLASAAMNQENKETLIGYFAASTFYRSATEREIDDVAEDWLTKTFGFDFVDFESGDALDKLISLRLVEVEPATSTEPKRYKAVSLDKALKNLDEEWDAFYNFD